MKKKLSIILALLLLVVTLGLVGGFINAANATDDDYEVTSCWEVDKFSSDTPDRLWPQLPVPCDFPPSDCTEHMYQVDTYWIRDQGDADYLAGLNILLEPNGDSSTADGDDETLEPHDYYMQHVEALPAKDCEPPAKKYARVQVIAYCDGAYVQMKKGAHTVFHRKPTARKHVFGFEPNSGWQFHSGEKLKKVVVYEKRGGACGSSSS